MFLIIFWSILITITEVLITINKLYYILICQKGMGLGQSDYINRMITLSVITLSGFHCSTKYLSCVRVFILKIRLGLNRYQNPAKTKTVTENFRFRLLLRQSSHN
jgi:hypothetical protein